ncbi:MAG: HEPN domain-containing protein [Anaerolineales bacterium]|nr:HEPN domain-containing protein [Anaerolineales bacterium]
MKEDDPLAWVEKAEEDWVTANTMMKKSKVFTGIVCYHFQQCAEKYIKAVIIHKGSTFPKTHDLNALNSISETNGILIGMTASDLETLSGYATAARYPSADPTKEDMQEAALIAKTIRKFSRAFLGLK